MSRHVPIGHGRVPVMDAGRATVAEALPDILQFMRLLWALVHGLDKTSKRMSFEVGITGPQRLVLRVAGLFPGLSAGDLAALLHVHPSTLTGVLQRLVAQRLLARVNDPRDRRRAILNLTARGARINSAHRGTVEAAVEAALREVTARDQAITRRVLQQLTDQLGVTESPGRAPSPGLTSHLRSRGRPVTAPIARAGYREGRRSSRRSPR